MRQPVERAAVQRVEARRHGRVPHRARPVAVRARPRRSVPETQVVPELVQPRDRRVDARPRVTLGDADAPDVGEAEPVAHAAARGRRQINEPQWKRCNVDALRRGERQRARRPARDVAQRRERAEARLNRHEPRRRRVQAQGRVTGSATSRNAVRTMSAGKVVGVGVWVCLRPRRF
jgi:hypothetical protein